jgi:hypothetical protein
MFRHSQDTWGGVLEEILLLGQVCFLDIVHFDVLFLGYV